MPEIEPATPPSTAHAQAAETPRPVPAVPERPEMPELVAAWLEERLRQSKCYVEYGAGGSTRLAADIGVPRIVAVESDRAFAKSVRRAINRSGTKSVVDVLHADIGPTQDWGAPRYYRYFRRWPVYPLGLWEFVEEHGLAPDLVLIDGRFRMGCLLASLLEAAPGTPILFDDYADRKEYYGLVEQLIEPSELIDRAALFVVPEGLPVRKVAHALARYVIFPE